MAPGPLPGPHAPSLWQWGRELEEKAVEEKATKGGVGRRERREDFPSSGAGAKLHAVVGFRKEEAMCLATRPLPLISTFEDREPVDTGNPRRPSACTSCIVTSLLYGCRRKQHCTSASLRDDSRPVRQVEVGITMVGFADRQISILGPGDTSGCPCLASVTQVP
jgi:hypothetical protein